MPHKDPEARKAYVREWVRKRRAEWIAANGPCAECGSKRNLEVDHIDPSRKVSHRIWTWAEKRRRAELAKCQVLCRRCHKAKTARQKREQVQEEHGTHRGYCRGCRCAPCKKGHAEYMREWVAANPEKRAAAQRRYATRG